METFPEGGGGTRWACEVCTEDPAKVAARGCCTGTLRPESGCPPDDRWGGLRALPGHFLTGPALAEMSFPVCPEGLAQRQWVRDIFRVYRAVLVDGVTLRDIVPDPTPALVDALTLIHEQRNAVESRRMDLEVKKARRAGKGKANGSGNR